MKSLILLSFVLISSTQRIECPQEIDTSIYCTQEYVPVCTYDAHGFQRGTYQNSCFACRDEEIISYEADPCIISTHYTTSNSDGSTAQSIVVYPCKIPKDDENLIIDCDTEYIDEVCGLFNKNVQCYKEPCGKVFDNDCMACTQPNVESYIKGDCNDYPSGIISTPTSPFGTSDTKGVINYQCSKTRPTSCDDSVNVVCANYQCKNSICKKELINECTACLDSTTLSYQRNQCDFSYQQLLTLAFIIQLLL